MTKPVTSVEVAHHQEAHAALLAFVKTMANGWRPTYGDSDASDALGEACVEAEALLSRLFPTVAESDASRPTLIRILSDTYGLFTIGKVYLVLDWEDGSPRIVNDYGQRTISNESKWEPC